MSAVACFLQVDWATFPFPDTMQELEMISSKSDCKIYNTPWETPWCTGSVRSGLEGLDRAHKIWTTFWICFDNFGTWKWMKGCKSKHWYNLLLQYAQQVRNLSSSHLDFQSIVCLFKAVQKRATLNTDIIFSCNMHNKLGIWVLLILIFSLLYAFSKLCKRELH